MNEYRIIEGAALDMLTKHAVNAPDGFRQWLYRDLPQDYTISDAAKERVHQGIVQGKSAERIVGEILGPSNCHHKDKRWLGKMPGTGRLECLRCGKDFTPKM